MRIYIGWNKFDPLYEVVKIIMIPAADNVNISEILPRIIPKLNKIIDQILYKWLKYINSVEIIIPSNIRSLNAAVNLIFWH